MMKIVISTGTLIAAIEAIEKLPEGVRNLHAARWRAVERGVSMKFASDEIAEEVSIIAFARAEGLYKLLNDPLLESWIMKDQNSKFQLHMDVVAAGAKVPMHASETGHFFDPYALLAEAAQINSQRLRG